MQDDFKFFRNYFEILRKMPANKCGKLVIAMCEYILNDKEPVFSETEWGLAGVFASLRLSLDKAKTLHEKRSVAGAQGGRGNTKQIEVKDEREENKEKQEQSKEKQTQSKTKANESKEQANSKQTKAKQETRNKKLENIKEKNKEEKDFLSQKFLEKFPNKDASLTDDVVLPEGFNLDALLIKVSESDFLSKCNNLGLAWCLEHYAEILADKYKNFKQSQQNADVFVKRKYSQEEIESVFDNFNEIDL